MLNQVDQLKQPVNNGALSSDGARVFSAWAVLPGAAIDIGVFYLLTGGGVALGAAHMVSFLMAALVFYAIKVRRGLPVSSKARNTYLKAYVTVILMALFLRGGVLADFTQMWGWSPQRAILVAALAAYLTVYLGLTRFVFFPALSGPLSTEQWRAVSLGLLIYALLLRLVYVGLPELLHEEAYYWNYAQHLDIGYLDHPPLVGWIIWLFTSVMGHTELAVRCGAFAIWIVGAHYVYHLTRRIFDKITAIGAVLLFATLPVYFCLGFVMLPDTPLVACWAGALYYLYRLLIDERPRAWLGVGIFVGLGMLAKYTIVLLGGAGLVFVLMDSRSRKWLLRPEPYLAVLVAIVLFSPVVVWNVQNEWASFVFQGSRRVTGSFDFDLPDLIGSALILLTPVGVLAVVAVAASKKFFTAYEDTIDEAKNARTHRLLMTLTFLPFTVFLAFSLFRNIKLNWTGPLWLGTLPYLAYLVMHRLPQQPGKLLLWARRPLKATIVIILLVYGAGLHYLVLGFAGLPYPKNVFGLGWPALARQVEALVENHEQKTGERPLVVGMDTDRINSWLAFYRSQAMTKAKGATTNEGARQTAGRHLFGQNSGMYLFWFPTKAQERKAMVLVGRTPEELKGDHITSRARQAHEIKEMVARKNGKIAGRYYYRLIEGYQAN